MKAVVTMAANSVMMRADTSPQLTRGCLQEPSVRASRRRLGSTRSRLIADRISATL